MQNPHHEELARDAGACNGIPDTYLSVARYV
jgi:hypothetical protein